MIETLIALFCAHVLADFLLQTDDMVQKKSKLPMLFYHGVVVFLTAVVLTGNITLSLLALALLHIAIDFFKTRFGDNIQSFLIDQLVHFVTLVAISWWQPDLWQNGIWSTAPNLVHVALIYVTTFILVTQAGSITVEKLVNQLGINQPAGGHDSASRIIGNLERLIILAMVLHDKWEGIGFLLAAKVVMRFQTGTKTTKENEFVFIGTLASYGWAILVSITVIFVLSKSASLGIIPENP